MDIISGFVEVILHLDKYLGAFINNYGVFTYVILFLIILVETGLIIAAFLPGDSVIFAASAFAAMGLLNIWVLVILLLTASILGDTINYSIGRYLGGKILEKGNSKLIKKEHIDKTNSYYEKYGGKTIVIARFIPIVRTFAPFVAGIGSMDYKEFITYNVLGGVIWVISVSILGYFFGNIPAVANNFSLVALGIILVSLIPIFIGVIKSKLSKENKTKPEEA